MSELMRNPRVLRKAQAEVRDAFEGRRKLTEDDVGRLSYMHLVIREALRLHVPLPFLVPRQCREPCEVMGYDIPAFGGMAWIQVTLLRRSLLSKVELQGRNARHGGHVKMMLFPGRPSPAIYSSG